MVWPDSNITRPAWAIIAPLSMQYLKIFTTIDTSKQTAANTLQRNGLKNLFGHES